jgi:uncharacterized coiled-coil protein SlyX
MEKEYLSIKECAAAAGVSVQSVYNRIKESNNKIQKYIKIKDGKKVISAAALDDIYQKGFEYDEIEESAKEDSIVAILNKQIELLENQVAQQQAEIERKNEHIASLLEQLQESGKRESTYQTLLNQEQQLAAADKQKLLALESPESKAKRGLFGIFKKRG